MLAQEAPFVPLPLHPHSIPITPEAVLPSRAGMVKGDTCVHTIYAYKLGEGEGGSWMRAHNLKTTNFHTQYMEDTTNLGTVRFGM